MESIRFGPLAIETIQRVSFAVSKDDARENLKHILMEHHGNHRWYTIATNGYILAIGALMDGNDKDDTSRVSKFLIPPSAIQAIQKAGKYESISVESSNPEMWNLRLFQSGTSFVLPLFSEIGFPNISEIVSSKLTEENLSCETRNYFDPRWMDVAYRIAGIKTPKQDGMRSNYLIPQGEFDSVNWVLSGDVLIGVMPVVCDEKRDGSLEQSRDSILQFKRDYLSGK